MKLTKLENLLLNMSSGLMPEDLQKDEIELLIEEFGYNWFEELGYDDSYNRPKI